MNLEISYEWGSLIKFWFKIGSKKYYAYCMWSYDIICINHNRFTKSKGNYKFYYELGDRCLFFCTFSFDHCSSSICGFWLPLWFLQTLPNTLPYMVHCQTVMNEERTGKCLRQTEHCRGHLWHRYSMVMVVTSICSIWILGSVVYLFRVAT
jgi:hypothetical protein